MFKRSLLATALILNSCVMIADQETKQPEQSTDKSTSISSTENTQTIMQHLHPLFDIIYGIAVGTIIGYGNAKIDNEIRKHYQSSVPMLVTWDAAKEIRHNSIVLLHNARYSQLNSKNYNKKSSKMKCDSNPCIIMGTYKSGVAHGKKVYPFYRERSREPVYLEKGGGISEGDGKAFRKK